MDCRTFHRKLEDYLEGGLDFPSRFGMERHAAQCYACEKDVTAALSLRQMTHELQRVGAPAEFEAALLDRIQAEKSHRRSWKLQSLWLYGMEGWSWRVAGATALVTMLIVGAAFYVYKAVGSNQAAMSRFAKDAVGTLEGGLRSGVGSATPDANTPGQISALDLDRAGQGILAKPLAEPADSDYVEFVVPVSGDRQLVLRLPRTIRMRNDQPSGEYFIRNISY